MIFKCKNPDCTSEYQDALYGNHKRVMNAMRSGAFRCTICGTEQSNIAKPEKILSE